jgi:hypothetical protein
MSGTETTLLVLQALGVALTLGINVAEAIERVSALLRAKHAAGETLTREELVALFDAGDAVFAAELARVEEAAAALPAGA